MSSLASPTIFTLGATGFIGGAILHGIHQAHPEFQIAALVRSEKDDQSVSAAFGGARIVRGSFDDPDLIEDEAAKANVVINSADADGAEAVAAILRGVKKRFEKTKVKSIYLHTSGTGVISQGKDGTFVKEAEKLVNDASEKDIEGIDVDQPHRRIDLSIFAANSEGYVDAFIIAPSAIYGKGTGPVRTQSAQIPEHVLVALEREQVVHYGPGTNEWNFVHIDDLESLYVLVFDLAWSRKDKEGSFGRFYFGSPSEIHNWAKVTEALVPILDARGKLKTEDILSVTLAEEKGPRGYLPSTAVNSRSKADRGIALGWKPRENGVWATLEQTVDAVIRKDGL